jgi:hypothetical protein
MGGKDGQKQAFPDAANYSTSPPLTNGEWVMPQVEYDYIAPPPFVQCEC